MTGSVVFCSKNGPNRRPPVVPSLNDNRLPLSNNLLPKKDQTMPRFLPPELISEILSRLPVRCLLRLRCVSKLFRSTIDGPDFVKLQLANSHRSILIAGHQDFFSLEFDSLKNPEIVKVPLAYGPTNRVYPIGIYNGLICVSDTNGDVALVNIATRKQRILPRCEWVRYHSFDVFGYDPRSDDYKVVRLISPLEYKNTLWVYSLKQNAWRKVSNDLPHSFPVVYCSNVCILGKIHMIVFAAATDLDTTNIIVSFDLSNDEYNELPLPDSLLSSYINLPSLTVLGGCLCVVSSCDTTINEDIWVMKEYGIKESWVKLFSVQRNIHANLYPNLAAYSRNGDRVLLSIRDLAHEVSKLAWYDLKKKKMKFVGKLKRRLPRVDYVGVTVESLVSLEEEEKEPQEKNKVDDLPKASLRPCIKRKRKRS